MSSYTRNYTPPSMFAFVKEQIDSRQVPQLFFLIQLGPLVALNKALSDSFYYSRRRQVRKIPAREQSRSERMARERIYGRTCVRLTLRSLKGPPSILFYYILRKEDDVFRQLCRPCYLHFQITFHFERLHSSSLSWFSQPNDRMAEITTILVRGCSSFLVLTNHHLLGRLIRDVKGLR